jgi:hypothetical protein
MDRITNIAADERRFPDAGLSAAASADRSINSTLIEDASFNQSPALNGVDLFSTDRPLVDAARRALAMP